MTQNLLRVYLLSFFLVACGESPPSYLDSESNPQSSSCGPFNEFECDIYKLTNQERIKNGLQALEICSACFQMAKEHSMDMSERGYFSHDRPEFPDRPAESFSQRAGRFGLSWGAGENIAMGYPSAESTFNAWMNSSGHRANILRSEYRSIGVGYHNGYATQVFFYGTD